MLYMRKCFRKRKGGNEENTPYLVAAEIDMEVTDTEEGVSDGQGEFP